MGDAPFEESVESVDDLYGGSLVCGGEAAVQASTDQLKA
jgi:hypothetical protein